MYLQAAGTAARSRYGDKFDQDAPCAQAAVQRVGEAASGQSDPSIAEAREHRGLWPQFQRLLTRQDESSPARLICSRL